MSEAELAKPDAADAVQIEAWYMDNDTEADQRLPHKQTPNRPATGNDLRRIGVLSWKLDADNHATDPRFAAVRKVRGYSYSDLITVSRESLPDYDNKLKIFFTEHIHSDEEIRYIIEGSGYFDVRDGADQWIRVACKKGDMIVLPEGIYHRFTLDEGNYAKVIRLFVGDPVWTPINRPCDENPSRLKYLKEVLVA